MDLLTHRPGTINQSRDRKGADKFAGFFVSACLRARLAWILAGLLFTPQLHAQGPSAASLEYQVKAAFLLNFSRYVEWPAATFPSPDAPITICILGQDPFGPILDQLVQGERANNRPIRVQRSVPEASPQGCHIAFIGLSERTAIAEDISGLRGSRVLTVSEVPGFADAGGMIEFILVEGKVRFYINSAAAQAAGLTLSSRLLRVATQIRGPQR